MPATRMPCGSMSPEWEAARRFAVLIPLRHDKRRAVSIMILLLKSALAEVSQ